MKNNGFQDMERIKARMMDNCKSTRFGRKEALAHAEFFVLQDSRGLRSSLFSCRLDLKLCCRLFFFSFGLCLLLICMGCDSEPKQSNCDDPLGCVVLAAHDPIHIAALQTWSGETRMLGVDQFRGIQLAFAEKDNSLLGHPIQLNRFDSMCSLEGGKIAAQKAVSNEKAVAVLGTTCSIAAVPAARIVSESGLSIISSSNTAPSLTSVRGKPGKNNLPGYFRVAHNDIYQGEAAAIFAKKELGLSKAATIHDGDPYTKELAKIFQDVFKQEGGSIVFAGGINKGDSNMQPILRAVLDFKAEVLFFPLFQPEGDCLVKQASQMPGLEDLVLLAAEGLLVDPFLDSVGKLGKGMYFIGPAKPKGSDYQSMVQRYRSRYGQPPQSPYHAHAYDAARILLQVIQKAAYQAEDGSIFIGRGKIRDELYSLNGYQGITGRLSCNKFGDCGASKFNVVRLEDQDKSLNDLRNNVIFTYQPRARQE